MYQDENLKALYQQTFHKVRNKIGSHKIGVLYEVIRIILEPDQSTPEEIRNYFSIQTHKTKKEELQQFGTRFDGKFASNILDNNKITHVNKEKKEDMELLGIVVIAFTLIGAFTVAKKRNNQPKIIPPVPENPKAISEKTTSQITQKLTVALCLVVPASVLGNVEINHPIRTSQIEELIDKSLYFLCTTLEDANQIWGLLDKTDEDIKTVSEQREVYIRIDIPNGEEMLGKKVPYSIKKNLLSHRECFIQQIACLKYLSVSGLENFNRI
ncbi:MAG TPA: hypothetical protein VK184_23215 [Nostocaceae cyanobacterium]|nr:hypothetical protein [Nostocaceae cyanobacterium]